MGENLGLQENHMMQIWKPPIMVKRWQPSEKRRTMDLTGLSPEQIYDYEIWFGLEDEDVNVNYEKQIVIYNIIAEEHPEVLDSVANDQDVQSNQIQGEPPKKQPKKVVERPDK